MAGWWLALIALLYIGGLFSVAWYGDHAGARIREKWRPYIYSLSLAVYCTAWTFFGAVGQASQSILSYPTIYIGPILFFIFFWKLLNKLILVSKRENITSIADFIASRHGKSRGLAILVTILLVVGILPYIALQLKAIIIGFDLLSPNTMSPRKQQDVALVVTLLLAVFVIMFGTRRLDTTEHQHGVMLAIAFESLLKLAAFLIVGGWITYRFFTEAHDPVAHFEAAIANTADESLFLTLMAPIMVSMAAFICLPRQFHVLVVENSDIKDLQRARWLFPIYLLLTAVFVLPMAYAGNAWLGKSISPDSFVIALPKLLGSESMAVLAFMAGLSAAISMVIVATISMTNMISNEILMPLILRSSGHGRNEFYRFSGLLRNVRRTTIIGLLLLAYIVYRIISAGEDHLLANLGLISFAAVAQLAPCVLGALYLRESNYKAAAAGILTGGLVWLVTLIVPLFVHSGWLDKELLEQGVLGIEMLKPAALFGFEVTGTLQGASIFALVVNTLVYVLGCLLFKVSPLESRQARRFVDASVVEGDLYEDMTVTVDELESLASRFLGEEKTRKLIADQMPEERPYLASSDMIGAVARGLSGIMGASSAKLVMKTALSGDNALIEDVEAMVDEASEVLQFNRELLTGAIEHIDIGVSVVDRDLRLVAWNQRYLELFDYPEGMIKVGRHAADIIRYNAERGYCGPGDVNTHVRKRINHMLEGTAHKSERIRESGQVIETRGYPMPGGGFVMSFTDITEFRQVEQALKDVNESLEQRVEARTSELNSLNRELMSAKGAAERANHLRSKFFAAISHDLMQPMNAARLFASSLDSSLTHFEHKQLSSHLNSSLRSAEELIKDLLDLSRLEAGKLKATFREFPLSEILDPMKVEFDLLAQENNQTFRMVQKSVWVHSDPVLLRRVLQNFLTNAFRYCNPQIGKVMLCCRKRGGQLCIEVRDNGNGIPDELQSLIFSEFERLHQGGKGLGLGLSIAQGIASVLHQPIGLKSREGKGTVFSIEMPLAEKRTVRQLPVRSGAGLSMKGMTVLCIDNEPEILLGMQSLLARWGCKVLSAASVKEAFSVVDECGLPDILLVDYRLEDSMDGIQLAEALREQSPCPLPAILITADKQDSVRNRCRELDIKLFGKPVKPASLRALMSSLTATASVKALSES
ncbi:PAS domain-containing hybrid sensor histidine kinase/response regulator [Endozoicomonas arenosclerae]|uniref:hybrid sensor histidine kinase/response regulator n=1 Tax=Endozoicomonas arenosclerae TaxID=1633495 RepID=UPI0009A18DB4|nr:PAS domain-containing hybrid sensor histidine kinase/response regulator [Endozoicomonas arenosclerae]